MTSIDLGLLILRLAVGLTFAAHGAQKAFGWWSGPGPVGWHGAIERMGFRPVSLWALVSTAIELIGGLLFAAGFLTPFAAAALVAQSLVIIFKAHFAKGFFSTAGGYEFPLSLGATALAVATMGAGAISLDAFLRLSYGDGLRAGLVILAIVGAAVALAVPGIQAVGRPGAPQPR